jgi:uncharacterized protein YkwD
MKRKSVMRMIAVGMALAIAVETEIPAGISFAYSEENAYEEYLEASEDVTDEASEGSESGSDSDTDEGSEEMPEEEIPEEEIPEETSEDISEEVIEETPEEFSEEVIEEEAELFSEDEDAEGLQDYFPDAEPEMGEAPVDEDFEYVDIATDLYGDSYIVEEEEPETLSLGGEYHSKNEIWQYIKDHPSKQLAASDAYAKAPSMSKPYSIGTLKESALNYALNGMNQIRFAAGLQEAALNDEYNMLSQAGSYLNAKNNSLTHYPKTPSGMSDDDEIVINGKKGASSSNIAWNYGSLSRSMFAGWLNDSDSSNISRMGHRRWILEPGLLQAGFGHVGAYTSMYAFGYEHDMRNTGAIIAMPCQNMPLNWIDSSFAWSVSFGTYVDKDEVLVTLVRDRDNKKWKFSSASSNGYFNVDNAGYGDTGCVIFRPSGISYADGDTFTVTIEGAREKTLVYTVDIFNAHGSQKPEAFPEEVVLDETQIEIPTSAKYQFVATVLPARANQQVTWMSSDPETVSVAADGTISALKEGEAIITATTKQAGEDGELRQAFCTVSVVKPTLNAPALFPESGKELSAGDEVEIRSASNFAGSRIYYSIPELGIDDQVYAGAIAVTGDMEGKAFTVTAVERCEGANDSPTVTASYTVLTSDKKGSVEDEDYEAVEGNVPDGIWIRGLSASYEYTGKAVTEPDLRVYYRNRLLAKGKDYTLKFTGNTNVGTAVMTIVMKGDYQSLSPVVYEFAIAPLSLADSQFTAADMCIPVKKDKAGNVLAQKPAVVLNRNGKKLAAKSGKVINYEMSYYRAEDTEYTTPLADVSEAGDYVARFVGVNNYCGEKTVNIKLTDAVRMSALKAGGYAKTVNYVYGVPEGIQAPDVTALKIMNGKEEVPSDCYTVSFENAENPGKAFIVVTAKDEVADRFAGTLKLPYTIQGTPLKKAVVTYDKELVYTGEDLTPVPVVTAKKYVYNSETRAAEVVDVRLVQGTDFVLGYEKNTGVGTAKIVLTGMNGYTGTVKLSFKITAKNVANLPESAVTVTNARGEAMGTADAKYPFLKKGVKPTDLIVEIDGNSLTAGKDYTLGYSNTGKIASYDMKNASGKSIAPTVNIKLKGNYKGTITKTFSIIPVDIGTLSITVQDVPYKEAAGIYKSAPVIVDKAGTKLVAGTDYEKNIEYTYAEYTKVKRKVGARYVTYYRAAGAAANPKDIFFEDAKPVIRVKVTGKGNYANDESIPGDGTISATFRISDRSINDITFKVDDFEYTGGEIKPLRVTDGSTLSGIHAHYTEGTGEGKITVDACADNSFVIVSYASNIKRGTGKITVRGTGKFAGTRTVTFKIIKRTAQRAD